MQRHSRRHSSDSAIPGSRPAGGAIALLILTLLTTAPLGAAQAPAKVARIGLLGLSAPSAASHLWEAFRHGLRDLGWVEGKNIAIQYRSAEGRAERLPDLAAEPVRLRVDAIVVATTPAAVAAKQATATIPIVLAGVGDPTGSGLVASLARPGGNITGLPFLASELSAKQLELLKEAVPKVSRVALLWNPANAGNPPQLREAEVAARTLGVRLQPFDVRGPNDFDRAFAAMTRGRAGALIVLVDVMLVLHRAGWQTSRPRTACPRCTGYVSMRRPAV